MSDQNPSPSNPHLWAVWAAYAVLLSGYYWIFGAFFPNRLGLLGHDYSGALPAILDSYFWFRNNSIFEVPWFTPSFCGGQPFFANAGGLYYSLPTFFSIFVDPLSSIRATFIVLAALGAWGMHKLLRDAFEASDHAALLGGGLFLFNGFYAHRMMIGHINFQAFMLLPWVAWGLLAPTRCRESRRRQWFEHGFQVMVGGLLVAYWVFSGFTSLALPAGLSILAVAGLCLLGRGNWSWFLGRSFVVAVVGLALSASALFSGQAFLSHFPRSEYSLPGIKSLADALFLLLGSLFLSPANIANIAAEKLTSLQWGLDRHEWEFGLTPIPLALILVYWILRLFRRTEPRPSATKGLRRNAALAVLGLSLVTPLLVNLYHPDWNAWLKQLPVLKNSSGLIRWWIVYIPITIVYAALAIDRMGLPTPAKTRVVFGLLCGILYFNSVQDREFYHQQAYDPAVIDATYWASRRGEFIPEIHYIAATQNSLGKILTPPDRNDRLAHGESQLACYNPSFGYRLENFPYKSLHIGSIYAQQDGYLNLKNPACYVFPEANNCLPGDHFLTSQMSQAQAFARYKPFEFQFSSRQWLANWISVVAVVVVTLLLVFSAIGLVLNRPRHSGA